MSRIRLLSTVAAFITVVSISRAQTFSYEWDYLGTMYSSGASVNVPDTGTFTIGVYLRETGGSSLLSVGMASAGVWVDSSDGVTGASVASPDDITGNVTGGGFTDLGLYVRDTSDPARAILTMARIEATGGATGTGPDGRIWLGNFLYTAGQNETILTASNPSEDDFNRLYSGEAIFPSTALLTLTPVPEPSTIMGLSAVAVFGQRIVRRRRVSV